MPTGSVHGRVINRNTLVLCLAQCMFVSGTVLMVTIGGIVGTDLSPIPVLATLPMSLMVVGTALSTVPASLLMQRFGRRAGFVSAAVVGMMACQLGIHALRAENFMLFCLTAGMIGMTIAFSQQFRFAAAESVSTAKVSQAISFILLGSIGGALIGPKLASLSPAWTPDLPFQGGFAAATVCYGLAMLSLLGFRAAIHPTAASEDVRAPRRLLQILIVPVVAAAILAGVVGQGVMTFIMTATPVSMHVVDGYALADTAAVIRAHVLAMYLPSLFSGQLIAWLGERRVMALGVAALAVTVLLGMLGHEYMHYWGALVLLGIGWNFLFVGGTTMLVRGYRPVERFRVQALNDFSVFGVSALASLLGGAVLLKLGWESVLQAAIVPLAVMLMVLIWLSERRIEASA